MNNCRPFNLHSEIVTRVEKVIKKKKRKKLSSVKLSFHLPIIDNGVWPFSPEQRYISIDSPFCSLLHFFFFFFFFARRFSSIIFSLVVQFNQFSLFIPPVKTKRKRRKRKKKPIVFQFQKLLFDCLYDINIYRGAFL